MEGFKEFQGKDLDGAIEEACGYFNTAREKLEIEIVQDAKSASSASWEPVRPRFAPAVCNCAKQ